MDVPSSEVDGQRAEPQAAQFLAGVGQDAQDAVLVLQDAQAAAAARPIHEADEDASDAARAKRRRGKNGGSKAAPSIAVLPAVSALAPASEEPIEVRWTDGPQPVEDSPDDGLDSWQLVIEAKAAYPPELTAMLPSIDQEADHFRRAGALRLWTQAVCDF